MDLLDEITPDDERAEQIASDEMTFHELAEQHVAGLLATWPRLSAEQGTLVVRMFGPRPTLPAARHAG
jgi:hypothetical protein